MKPRFEEHEGKLFRMLEKPDAINEFSKTPCVIACKYGGLKKYYILDFPLSNPSMSMLAEGFEIIGYPVEEGSHWWALYQMMQDNTVVSPNGIKYRIRSNRIVWDIEDCWEDFCCISSSAFPLGNEVSGWQIYEEPKHPKPLLADAQVGDLCKHRNGDWSQIIDTNGTYIQGQPIRTTLKDTEGINRNFCLSGSHFIMQFGGRNFCLSGSHFIMQFGGKYDIIHTEPLAPEGSAEWALQMWKLGNDIRNETGVVLMADYESEEIRVKHLVDVFPSGWQLYKEPEPAKEPIADCDNCKHACTKSNIDHCHMYEPKPTFKVGDFVVCTYYRSPLPQKNSYERVIDVSGNGIVTKANDGCVTEYDINGNHGDINGWHIERLVKPEEYIICIGCLSGTVEKSQLFHKTGFILVGGAGNCWISFNAINKETLEIVECLLKAQDEGE